MDKWCIGFAFQFTLLTQFMPDELEMDNMDPHKGRIPLVMSTDQVKL